MVCPYWRFCTWSAGGRTDLDAMALVCGRHHTEIHLGIWTITIRNGTAYVKVPPWHHLAHHTGGTIGHPTEPGLLRNPTHTAITQAHTLAQQLHLDLDDS